MSAILLARLQKLCAYHEAEAARWRTAIATIEEFTDEAETPRLPHRKHYNDGGARQVRGPYQVRAATNGMSIRAAVIAVLDAGPCHRLTDLLSRVEALRGPTNNASLRVEINRLLRVKHLIRHGHSVALPRDAEQFPTPDHPPPPTPLPEDPPI